MEVGSFAQQVGFFNPNMTTVGTRRERSVGPESPGTPGTSLPTAKAHQLARQTSCGTLARQTPKALLDKRRRLGSPARDKGGWVCGLPAWSGGPECG